MIFIKMVLLYLLNAQWFYAVWNYGDIQIIYCKLYYSLKQKKNIDNISLHESTFKYMLIFFHFSINMIWYIKKKWMNENNIKFQV